MTHVLVQTRQTANQLFCPSFRRIAPYGWTTFLQRCPRHLGSRTGPMNHWKSVRILCSSGFRQAANGLSEFLSPQQLFNSACDEAGAPEVEGRVRRAVNVSNLIW